MTLATLKARRTQTAKQEELTQLREHAERQEEKARSFQKENERLNELMHTLERCTKILGKTIEDLQGVTDEHRQSHNLKHAGTASYGYIPLNQFVFFHALHCAIHEFKQHNKTNERICFVECGSGNGLKTKMAWAIGLDACGIELNKELHKLSVKLKDDKPSYYYTNGKLLFVNGDILKHDYSQYHIAYFYCPIAGNNGEKKFEKRLIDQMPINSIIMAAYPNLNFHAIQRDKFQLKCLGVVSDNKYNKEVNMPCSMNDVVLWLKCKKGK